MKGRNSTVISIRLDDDVYAVVKKWADRKELTVSAYIKKQINHSVDTMRKGTQDALQR